MQVSWAEYIYFLRLKIQSIKDLKFVLNYKVTGLVIFGKL